jgi:hypothetical protein
LSNAAFCASFKCNAGILSSQEDLEKTVAVAGGVYKVVTDGAIDKLFEELVGAIGFFVADPEGEGAEVVDLGVGTGVGEQGEPERLTKSNFDQLIHKLD